MADLSDYTDDQLARIEYLASLSDADLEEMDAQSDGGSIADSLGQGAMFGFSDELAGGVGAVASMLPEGYGGIEGFHPIDAYVGTRDAARENLEAYRQREPMMAMGAEMGGAMLTGGVGGAAAARTGLSNMSRLKQLGTIGAAEGALYGAGAGEGLLGSMGGATEGAITGGGAGLLSRIPEKGLDQLARLSSKYKWQQPIRNQVEDMGGMEEVRSQLQRAHPESVLADITPEFRGMAGYAGNRSGGREIAEEFLTNRQRGMSGQIDTAGQNLSDTDYYRNMRQLQETRAADAEINYGAVRGTPVQIDESIGRAASSPDGLKAIGTAETRLKNRYQLDEIPDEMRGTVEYWDEWKKAMDGIANKYGRAGDGAAAGVAGEIRDGVVQNIDAQTDGAYAYARQQYAEPSKLMEAMESGREMYRPKLDPEEVIGQIGDMSQDQVDAFLSGVVREISKKSGDAPETANSAWNVIKSPNFQKKLRAAAGTDKADEFIETMRKVGDMNKTYNVVTQGSRTAPMQQVGNEIENVAGAAGRLAAGDPSAALEMARNALASKFRNMSRDDIENMIKVLLSRGETLESIMAGGVTNQGIMPGAMGAGAAVMNQ